MLSLFELGTSHAHRGLWHGAQTSRTDAFPARNTFAVGSLFDAGQRGIDCIQLCALRFGQPAGAVLVVCLHRTISGVVAVFVQLGNLSHIRYSAVSGIQLASTLHEELAKFT